MNKKQWEILNAIKEFRRVHGYAPSIRELGTIVGLSSTSTVYRHLTKLKEGGYIVSEPGKPRTFRVIGGE